MNEPVGLTVRVFGSRQTGRAVLRIAIAVGLMSDVSGTARAEEASGCAAFKWSLTREAELLQVPNKPALASGSSASVDGRAYDMKLVPLAEAHLPQPPGRTPKIDPSSAGFLRYSAPATAGGVQITSSAAVWIDVVQDGKAVKPRAFSGARDCPGVRKSLRFSLAASPFVVEISGTSDPSVGIIAAPSTP